MSTGLRFQIVCLVLGLLAWSFPPAEVTAQGTLIHLWDFEGGTDGPIRLEDSAGSLDLNFAPGEGNVAGVEGAPADVVFEPGFRGIGQAYRPYYVDVAASTTAGVGLTGSGFTSPPQFTIESIVKADGKTSGSPVNYLFQTRPGADRGYYLIQDEDGIAATSVGGLGTIIGNDFGNVGLGGEYAADGAWMYIAATVNLTPAGAAVVDVYSAILDPDAPPPTPTLVLSGKTYGTADPDTLSGNTGVFGIGGFAVDREGDAIAEASQEWFQGAIDYIAIYDGLLTRDELAANLAARFAPEPNALALLLVALCMFAGRRRCYP
jgi:hypothetical protein